MWPDLESGNQDTYICDDLTIRSVTRPTPNPYVAAAAF